MTAKATIFVQDWVQENLGQRPSSEEFESIPALVRRCLHEAASEGISEDEIEDEIGDLTAFMKEAIASATQGETSDTEDDNVE
ncbi:hypothetical protein [Mesorhizobium sp. 10J20-29]